MPIDHQLDGVLDRRCRPRDGRIRRHDLAGRGAVALVHVTIADDALQDPRRLGDQDVSDALFRHDARDALHRRLARYGHDALGHYLVDRDLASGRLGVARSIEYLFAFLHQPRLPLAAHAATARRSGVP